MPSKALAPAVHAVFFADAVGDDELMVAAHADVVVACVTFQTVIAGVGGWNRISADVAKGRECQGPVG